MIASAFLFGFSFANSSTAISVLTRETFGMENYTRVYPIMSFALAAANALAVTLFGMLYDAAGSYNPALILCLVLQTGVILLVLNLLRRKDRQAA
jgi:predicted MFS family arabinose efflux permease